MDTVTIAEAKEQLEDLIARAQRGEAVRISHPTLGAVDLKPAEAEPAAEAAPSKPTAYELGKHLFGKYASGRSDLSENADGIVREMIRAKHRR